MTDNVIKFLELNNPYRNYELGEEESEHDHEHGDECHHVRTIAPIIVNDNVVSGPSFLTATSRTYASTLRGLMFAADDVLAGTVEDEIDKISNENENINNIVSANTTASIELSVKNIGQNAGVAKVITFEKYEVTNNDTSEIATLNAMSGHNINTSTNTNNLLRCLALSEDYNEAPQKKILTGAVTILADWLDDYINNYDERVAEGKSRGDSEVKLSFLLRLRKAIENCDFPVGFGNNSDFGEDSGDSVTLGSYSWASDTSEYLNPFDHAMDNNAAAQHLYRSILLNPSLFIINRTYTSESEITKAINDGELDYIFDEDVTNEQLSKAYSDIVLSSDEVYYNFAETYIATILAHEFIHSTHISNEAVTYNACETMEDDFRSRIVSASWSASTQAAINTLYDNLELNELTYNDIYLPTSGGGGLYFHDLYAYDQFPTSEDNVVKHGYIENLAYEDVYLSDDTVAYKAWKNFETGNTLEDARKEVMNFVV